jgi:hypothetical protein
VKREEEEERKRRERFQRRFVHMLILAFPPYRLKKKDIVESSSPIATPAFTFPRCP